MSYVVSLLAYGINIVESSVGTIRKYAAMYWHVHCIKACLDEGLFHSIHAFLNMDASLLWSCLTQYRDVNVKEHDQITISIKHFKVTFGSLFLLPVIQIFLQSVQVLDFPQARVSNSLVEDLVAHLQATLKCIYLHMLSLDAQQIFPHIAHLCGLNPDMHYELIAQTIFDLPPDYLVNLTGSFVFTRVNHDTFLNFLRSQMSHGSDFIDPLDAHTLLATNCLLFLQKGSLGMQNTRVWKYVQAHWCDHLCHAQPNSRLLQLLYPSSLNWRHVIQEVDRILEWLNVSFICPRISFYLQVVSTGIPKHASRVVTTPRHSQSRIVTLVAK
jgi:hypothetical protein